MCDPLNITLDADEATYGAAAQRMVHQQLHERGIRDPRVLAAMRAVPRHLFVHAHLQARAYDDVALPTLNDQTISQPCIVAAMTEALDVHNNHHVLEIGTGSGYQTMILARLAKDVVSIERDAALAGEAESMLQHMGASNVTVHVGDGTKGWIPGAPYDRILVTAGGPRVPDALMQQLADGGRIVMPVGDRRVQELTMVESSGQRRVLMQCQFVPLVGEQGW